MSTTTAAPRAKSLAPADLAYVAVFAALLSALSQVNVAFGPVRAATITVRSSGGTPVMSGGLRLPPQREHPHRPRERSVYRSS